MEKKHCEIIPLVCLVSVESVMGDQAVARRSKTVVRPVPPAAVPESDDGGGEEKTTGR